MIKTERTLSNPGQRMNDQHLALGHGKTIIDNNPDISKSTAGIGSKKRPTMMSVSQL
jgi:hypothetical protein